MATLVRKKGKAAAEPDYYAVSRRVAAIAADKKAEDIRAYDVAGKTIVADSFVLVSAGSEPQMKAIFNALLGDMKEAGAKVYHHEGNSDGGWILIDFGSVVAHVFRKEARAFYDLDGLWADAPAIELHLED